MNKLKHIFSKHFRRRGYRRLHTLSVSEREHSTVAPKSYSALHSPFNNHMMNNLYTHLSSVSPGFPVNANEINFIATPSDFFNELKVLSTSAHGLCLSERNRRS
jgi:hypothetical protein